MTSWILELIQPIYGKCPAGRALWQDRRMMYGWMKSVKGLGGNDTIEVDGHEVTDKGWRCAGQKCRLSCHAIGDPTHQGRSEHPRSDPDLVTNIGEEFTPGVTRRSFWMYTGMNLENVKSAVSSIPVRTGRWLQRVTCKESEWQSSSATCRISLKSMMSRTRRRRPIVGVEFGTEGMPKKSSWAELWRAWRGRERERSMTAKEKAKWGKYPKSQKPWKNNETGEQRERPGNTSKMTWGAAKAFSCGKKSLVVGLNAGTGQ